MNVLLLPESTQCGDAFVPLTDAAQVHHLQTVIKPSVGDTIKVGVLGAQLGTARVAGLDEGGVTLTDIHCATQPPPKLNVTVVMALPRPKVLRRLIMDITAMGAAHIVLINSQQTNKSYWQSPMLQRLESFMLEGLRQAKDTVLPSIAIKKRFKPFVQDELTTLPGASNAVVCHPYADQTWNAYQQKHGLPGLICIGAEGGWIDYELQLMAQQQVTAVGLGHRILRTEAAVNAVMGRYLS